MNTKKRKNDPESREEQHQQVANEQGKKLHFDTIEEYRKATDTGGHHADDELDFKDIEQPQDKDKIAPQEEEE